MKCKVELLLLFRLSHFDWKTHLHKQTYTVNLHDFGDCYNCASTFHLAVFFVYCFNAVISSTGCFMFVQTGPLPKSHSSNFSPNACCCECTAASATTNTLQPLICRCSAFPALHFIIVCTSISLSQQLIPLLVKCTDKLWLPYQIVSICAVQMLLL